MYACVWLWTYGYMHTHACVCVYGKNLSLYQMSLFWFYFSSVMNLWFMCCELFMPVHFFILIVWVYMLFMSENSSYELVFHVFVQTKWRLLYITLLIINRFFSYEGPASLKFASWHHYTEHALQVILVMGQITY